MYTYMEAEQEKQKGEKNRETKADQRETKTLRNQTGIPGYLKQEMEEKSGLPLDHLRVEYNSPLPDRYGALAYLQDNRIYMKQGQEKHLRHEIVHGIQEMQGMTAGKTGIVDDPVLEAEADAGIVHKSRGGMEGAPAARGKQAPILRKVGMEFQTYKGNWNVKKLKNNSMKTVVESALSRGNVNSIKNYLGSADRVSLEKNSTFKYSVTTDGEDLEYVTNAFDEEKDAVGLRLAALFAGDFHEKISMGKIPFKSSAKPRKFGNYIEIEKNKNIYFINVKGERTAHPQATVGVEYEKIPALVERIVSAEEGDVLYQGVATAVRARKQLWEIQQSTDAYIEEQKEAGEGPESEERCRAFIELTEENLKAANYRYREDVQEKAVNSINNFVQSVNEVISETKEQEKLDIPLEDAMADIDKQFDILKEHIWFEDMFLPGSEKGREIWDEINQLYRNYENMPKRKAIVIKENLRSKWYNIRQKDFNLIEQIKLEAEKYWLKSVRLGRDLRDNANILRSRYQGLIEFVRNNGQICECFEIYDCYRKMVENAPAPIEKYFKTNLALKSRTSLYDLYRLLSVKDSKFVFRYLNSRYTNKMYIWESNYGDGSLITYKEWKTEMYSGEERDRDGKIIERSIRRDLLNYELENVWSDDNEELKLEKRGILSRYGINRSTDVGHDKIDSRGKKQEVDGAILELRKLEDKVHPNRWAEVADKIITIVKSIHR